MERRLGTTPIIGLEPSKEHFIPGNEIRAIVFSAFLQTFKGQEAICSAIKSMFDQIPNKSPCSTIVTNSKKTVVFSVTTIDSVAGTYALELTDKSSELSLKSPYWVERHRFNIGLGFNANLEPQVVVVDYEPMFRTTPELVPAQDELFEYIPPEHDSELSALQERVKRSITSYIEALMLKHENGLLKLNEPVQKNINNGGN